MTDAGPSGVPGIDIQLDPYEEDDEIPISAGDSGGAQGRPSIVRSSAVMASGTAVSRITGLVRVGALSFALGRTALSDAFNLANVAPNLIYELALGGVLSASLVPLFIATNEAGTRPDGSTGGDDDGRSAIISVGFVALTVLSVAAVLAATLLGGPLSHLLASTTGADDQVRRTEFTALAQLALPQILLYGITTFCTALLNARRRFAAAAYVPALNNVVSSLAFVLVGWRIGGDRSLTAMGQSDTLMIVMLGLGSTLGVLAMTFALFPAVRDAEPSLRWQFQPRHPAVRKLMQLSGWTVGYVVANQLALVVVYAVASRSGTGTLTAYTTAFIFFQLPHGLFAVSLMTTTMPELAEASRRHDGALFQRRWLHGLRLIWLVIIPSTVGYLLVAKPLMSVLLVRGRFLAADADITGRTLAAFAIGLPGFSIYLYALRAFYSGQDTRTPFMINLVENLLNIIFVLSFGRSSPAMLALAFSLAYLLAAALAVWRLHERLGGLGPELGATLKMMGQVLGAAGAMAVVVWLSQLVVGGDHGGQAVVRVVLSVIVGTAAYGAAVSLLKIEGTDRIVETVRRTVSRPRQ